MKTEMVKISIYINEADEWHHKPLHLAFLQLFKEKGLAGATVLHGVAGFTAADGIHTSSLVDVGGRLPLVVEFIDTEQKAMAVMPTLREMAKHRLIVKQVVTVID